MCFLLVAGLHLVVAKGNFFSLKKIKIVAAAKNYHSHFKYVFFFFMSILICV